MLNHRGTEFHRVPHRGNARRGFALWDSLPLPFAFGFRCYQLKLSKLG